MTTFLRFAIFLLLFNSNVFAANYFVSPSGNDLNNGLSISTAFETLNHAAYQTVAGDTVFVLAGTYTNNFAASVVLDIVNSGTASQPIVFTNYQDQEAIIQLGAVNWAGIGIDGADHIVVDGFKVIGNNAAITLSLAQTESSNLNNPATSGNGIGISRKYADSTDRPHHVTVRNCTVSDCGGGGIYTYWADYVTIENNTVFNCAWFSPFGNSGISLYQHWNSDSLMSIKNFVSGNTVFRNEMFIPWYVTNSITDGNGIIIDDFRNTQNNSPLGVYLGATYVSNNLVYDNGGRGIHTYSSNNVIVVNNTVYKNCQSPFVQDGEITAYDASNVKAINNISESDESIPPLFFDQATVDSMEVKNNVWVVNGALAEPMGVNTQIGDPGFFAPSTNPMVSNFQLAFGSIAQNNGSSDFAPSTDKLGVPRPQLGIVDIGCYEIATNATPTLNETYITIFPNPTTDNFEVSSNYFGEITTTILDVYGKKVAEFSFQKSKKVDTEKFLSGIYFVFIKFEDGNYFQKRMIKL